MRASNHQKESATAIARHPLILVIISAVVLAAALWASSVKAAPQALALVSTHGPIELICDNGECSIELTTFCLQKDRPAPEDGTAYEVAFGELRLEGITADGNRVTLDPKQAFEFTTQRSFTAMRISLSDDVEGAENFTAIDMFVPENVALVPMAVAGDPTPLTEMEVAMIGQSLRPFGNQIMDRDPDSMGAARILNRTLNRLPRDGWADPAASQKAWEDAVGSPDGQAASPEGLYRAKRSFDLCEWGNGGNSWSSMRRCMELEHDQLIREKNSEFWKGMDVGI
jgi:hypothetical protein